MSTSDLRTRLQRLRPKKIKRELPPSVPAETLIERRAQTLAQRRALADRGALPGREVVTPLGAFQLIEERYPLDFAHGPARLADAFARDPATAARLARDDALAQAGLRALAFLDTETTGLVGGAGTLVFLVGVGVCEHDEFVLRQYFLRDPGEEEALLTSLVSDLAERAGWVTFNGKAFDLPLLETRLTLNRQRGALGQRPHLDLLMPARRLYRGRLESCSLGSLEQHIFHILREQDDVPGELIPQMYQDYLRTGDAREMHRVIYHNAVDVLSMVTLTAHVLEVFGTELEIPSPESQVRGPRSEVGEPPITNHQLPISSLQPEDLLRLAQWHDDAGRSAEAGAAYRRALAGKLELNARAVGLRRYAALLKHEDRRVEAVPLWEQLASFTLDDPEPFVELAKYYEWHARDLPSALQWTERALNVVGSWPKGWQRDEAVAALERRQERLKGKMSH